MKSAFASKHTPVKYDKSNQLHKDIGMIVIVYHNDPRDCQISPRYEAVKYHNGDKKWSSFAQNTTSQSFAFCISSRRNAKVHDDKPRYTKCKTPVFYLHTFLICMSRTKRNANAFCTSLLTLFLRITSTSYSHIITMCRMQKIGYQKNELKNF